MKSWLKSGKILKRSIYVLIHGHALVKITGSSPNWYQLWRRNQRSIRTCMRISSEYWISAFVPLELGHIHWLKSHFIRTRCDHPVEMAGRSFYDIGSKHESMRCEDYYGHRPERDGPILVGIFIGKQIYLVHHFHVWFMQNSFLFRTYDRYPGDNGRIVHISTRMFRYVWLSPQSGRLWPSILQANWTQRGSTHLIV